jgi:hypothetical protein
MAVRKKAAKKRNAQDITLTNLRAVKARLARLEARVRKLEERKEEEA